MSTDESKGEYKIDTKAVEADIELFDYLEEQDKNFWRNLEEELRQIFGDRVKEVPGENT